MSCEYTNASSSCVAPSTYEYDSQSRVIKSWEPDAGTTLTYYDIAGRVRATQTQKQIDSDAYSVVGYDHLDRTVYTGEWKTDRDSAAVRAYFNDVQNQNNPIVDSLTPGTVTRTFYDSAPTDDTLNALNVKLIPAGEMLKYTRGRVAAVVSDVKAVLDDNGDPVPASNGKDSVIRVSTASSYDKYGRVVKAYAYDPTMPADSLKMLAVETEYDVGGKVLSTTKYPYGLKPDGMNRKITERYVYDRLGRVSDVYSKNGSGNKVPVAHYDYYPTGSVRTVKLGNSLTLSYTYHISGAVKTAEVRSADNRELYADTLYYEDCGSNACTPQYNGNISRMAHHLAHENNNYGEFRDVRYTYDELNRLTKVDDSKQDVFDEMFAYDAQGRITAQRRAGNVVNPTGGEYSYYSGKNRLKSVADNMGGTADERNMSDTANFVYDSVGNLTYDKSKGMEILYDWRGMPIEFIQQSQPAGSSSDTLFRLLMKYDGTGRRISKTVMHKVAGAADWDTAQVTHYTGIGTEIRENYAGPAKQTKVVVNMPQGLGRYGIEDAERPDFDGMTGDGLIGYIPNTKFEWYLKNHLGSTMLVYGTQADANPAHSDIGTPLAAYDYRAFGEMVELLPPPTGKVTENFTGKELDDEIALDYFGARYLDPMLGMWISVDPARQFSSPYLYAGNGMNPINVVDPDGEATYQIAVFLTNGELLKAKPTPRALDKSDALISYHDFRATQRWGRKTFGNDFDMKIIRNQDEMIEFVKAGKYTAIVGHSFGDEGMLVNFLDESAKFFSELSLLDLNKNLIGTDSYAKAFACFTGEWPDTYSNVDLGKNKDLLPIGDAYKNAGEYLVDRYNSTIMEKNENNIFNNTCFFLYHLC